MNEVFIFSISDEGIELEISALLRLADEETARDVLITAGDMLREALHDSGMEPARAPLKLHRGKSDADDGEKTGGPKNEAT